MNCSIKREFCDENNNSNKEKSSRIPRPPNAFMLYANENRKKMSHLYPTESNKDISKRLGNGWKSLEEDERQSFFDKAREIGIQHKKEHPDYVYNPKEARIRKAMRDATRERSIGASPMLPRPNARRAHSWVASHEELMMQQSPLQSMRSTIEPPPPPPPSCGGSGGGFPLSSAGNGSPFMTGSGGGYTKLEPSHSPMSSAGPAHSNYMQSTNPLAQLQQHAEMWDAGYHQSSICPKSPGNPYLMGDMSPYQHHSSAQQEVIHNEAMSIEEQHQHQQHPHLPSVHQIATNAPSITPPQPPNGENLSSPAPSRQSKQEKAHHQHQHHHSPRSHHSADMGVMSEEFETNSQTMMDQSGSSHHQPSTGGMDLPPQNAQQQDSHVTQQEQQQQQQQLQDHPSFMSVFGQQPNADSGGNVDSGRSFEKIDEAASSTAKMKKPTAPHIRNNNTNKKPVSKALPDFNEAFGSTERGRFQSPPDPRLGPNKGYLDYFFDTSPMKFDDYQI